MKSKSIGLALLLIVLLAAGCTSEPQAAQTIRTSQETSTRTVRTFPPLPSPTAAPTATPVPTPTPIPSPEPRIVDEEADVSFENFDFTIVVNCTVANFGVEGEYQKTQL